MNTNPPENKRKFITSIVNVDMEERRDRLLEELERTARGSRGQPPMVLRLRNIINYVEYLEQREGIPFATARNSKMNKRVRAWMNERMLTTRDPRKSRRGTIGEDAVEDVLKQVAALRK